MDLSLQINPLNIGYPPHHGVQGHRGEPHVPLGCGLRPNDHALTSRGLFEVQDALSTAAEAHVVLHVDPEPHGVGGDHVGVKVLVQNKLLAHNQTLWGTQMAFIQLS